MIKEIFKGESCTLMFTFPEAYNMGRIASHKVYIGIQNYTGVVDGQSIVLKLKSSDTDKLCGVQKVVLWFDDSTLGLRKPYCGDLVITKTKAEADNESESDIYDIIIPIVISETSVTVGDILYNYVKGANGSNGRGEISRELISTVGLIKTYRITYTDSTTFEYSITDGQKGDKGDAFEYSDFTPEQLLALTGDTGNGISSIVRTSGTGAAGTTDTYTITYTDSTTTTFQVVNGANGATGTGALVVGTTGTSTSSVMHQKSVTDELAAKASIVLGKNIFNKDTVSVGYYINQETGTLNVNAGYSASDYIIVNGLTNICISKCNTSGLRVAFYNSLKVFISGALQPANPIVVPVNGYYLRFSATPTTIANTQVESGISVTEYEEFRHHITKLYAQKYTDASIKFNKTDFIELGKNLFDKSTISTGYYVGSAGTLMANASYFSSDFISVKNLTNITLSNGSTVRLAFYNDIFEFMSYVYPLINPVTVPVGAYYMRFSSDNNSINNNVQLESGLVATPYNAFGYKFTKKVTPYDTENIISAFLPSIIYVAVGRTIEIYNNQVVLCGNPANFHFVWTCTKGRNMKRKWSYTGITGDIGNYTLTLNVYNCAMQIVATATTTIKVVSATMANTKTICPIGDSLTNEKAWLQEVRTLSADKISLVGTRGTGLIKHEGRSGWSAARYNLAGDALPNESTWLYANPFFDVANNRFNWSYYKTNSSVTPDAVQLFLGTNGITYDATANATAIKLLVDYIRQDDATIPIFIVYTLFRGDQNGILTSATWKYYEDAKVFNLMVRLNSLLLNYTNLYFIPLASCHDSEYNFGAVSTPVNPRASQTENLPNEATHPQTQGYLQFADIMFSTFAGVLV